MQIQAPIELSLFLKHYLFLDVKDSLTKNYRLFSNGNMGLVFTLNEELKPSKVNKSIVPKTFVFGQIKTPMNLELMSNSKILVVVFQPYGLHLLTNLPSKELEGAIIDAECIFGKEIEKIQNIIIENLKKELIISNLNNYFLSFFLKKTINSTSIVPLITNNIIQKKGNITIQNLKNDFYIHERKLQRLFLEQVGISPKEFIQITKLHSFIGHINSNSINNNITSSVFEAGYYDQSHLIRNFKKITGMTPTKYLNSSALAVNLVELQ